MKEIDSTDTDWHNAPIIAIPIFLGETTNGHWTNLIVDRRVPSLWFPGGLRVYGDSLSTETTMAHAEEMHQGIDLSPPLSTATNAATWSVASSPVQALGGNDCGAWTLVKFAAYMKASSVNALYVESPDIVRSSVSFEIVGNLSETEWARLGFSRLSALDELILTMLPSAQFVLELEFLPVPSERRHRLKQVLASPITSVLHS